MIYICKTKKKLAQLLNANADGNISPAARHNWERAHLGNPITDAKNADGILALNLGIQTILILCALAGLYVGLEYAPAYLVQEFRLNADVGIFASVVAAMLWFVALWRGSVYCATDEQVANSLNFLRSYRVAEVQFPSGRGKVWEMVASELFTLGQHMLDKNPHGHASPLMSRTDRCSALAKLLFGVETLSSGQQLEMTQAVHQSALGICGVEVNGVSTSSHRIIPIRGEAAA